MLTVQIDAPCSCAQCGKAGELQVHAMVRHEDHPVPEMAAKERAAREEGKIPMGEGSDGSVWRSTSAEPPEGWAIVTVGVLQGEPPVLHNRKVMTCGECAAALLGGK